MSELAGFLITVAMIAALCLVVIFATKAAIDNAVVWLDARSQKRERHVERELIKTKEALAIVSEAQATLLGASAHEAAVALILESYRASHNVAAEATRPSD